MNPNGFSMLTAGRSGIAGRVNWNELMSNKTPPFPEYPEWTEARFFQFLRSGLRKLWQRWPPKHQKVEQVKAKSSNKRYRWRYRCEECGRYYPKKEIEVHHSEPVGQLKSFEDLPGFVSRLFVGTDKLEALCKECHKRRA